MKWNNNDNFFKGNQKNGIHSNYQYLKAPNLFVNNSYTNFEREEYNENLPNNDKNKKLVSNLNLNGLSQKTNKSEIFEEGNEQFKNYQNLFLGKKREYENGDHFEISSDQYDEENKSRIVNYSFTINSRNMIRKIGAEIIKLSPQSSPEKIYQNLNDPIKINRQILLDSSDTMKSKNTVKSDEFYPNKIFDDNLNYNMFMNHKFGDVTLKECQNLELNEVRIENIQSEPKINGHSQLLINSFEELSEKNEEKINEHSEIIFEEDEYRQEPEKGKFGFVQIPESHNIKKEKYFNDENPMPSKKTHDKEIFFIHTNNPEKDLNISVRQKEEKNDSQYLQIQEDFVIDDNKKENIDNLFVDNQVYLNEKQKGVINHPERKSLRNSHINQNFPNLNNNFHHILQEKLNHNGNKNLNNHNYNIEMRNLNENYNFNSNEDDSNLLNYERYNNKRDNHQVDVSDAIFSSKELNYIGLKADKLKKISHSQNNLPIQSFKKNFKRFNTTDIEFSNNSNNSNDVKEQISRKSRSGIMVNNPKFSNTEIPSVFDEKYIQKRINKTEISSDNQAEFSEGNHRDVENKNENTKYSFDYSVHQYFLQILGSLGLFGITCHFLKNGFLNLAIFESIKNNSAIFRLIKNNYGVILILMGLTFCFLLYIKKFNEEEEKKIENFANEIYEEILNTLVYRNKEEIDPEIDVEEFLENYMINKNISPNMNKKLKEKINKILNKQTAEFFQTSLYIEGKLKSFWKLKEIKRCIE